MMYDFTARRSMFVVVGEKAKDQVVLLHHMLSKAAVKVRPSGIRAVVVRIRIRVFWPVGSGTYFTGCCNANPKNEN